MQAWEKALQLLPEPLQSAASREAIQSAEEIRLRLGQAPTILYAGEETVLHPAPVTSGQLERLVEKASGASLHAVIEAMREGYLSCGGLRIGLCGVAARSGEGMEGFRHITSLAIRIPRERPGLCKSWYAALYPEGFQNTLLLSPPGGGKTTALRDLIRELSERGWRVAVADERNELSASGEAGLGFRLGSHCDVLAGLPKAEASVLLLRAMNPQILAMDEVGSDEEVQLLRKLSCSGVGILASCHAAGVQELAAHPILGGLWESGVFTQALVIRREGAARRYTVERRAP